MSPKPYFSFGTRIDPETDARRRRIQEQTGWAAPRLVAEALAVLEPQIIGRQAPNEGEVAA